MPDDFYLISGDDMLTIPLISIGGCGAISVLANAYPKSFSNYIESANNGEFKDDGKNLFDWITKEEIWACTSCNACVETCPVNIDPLSIIMDMRRYLVMEESAAPAELNNMMQNVENNGAPWPYNQMDRLKWVDE